MGDSQANNDNRTEQPKNRWEELARRKKAEYDELMRIAKERVEEMNADRGKLPELVIKGYRVELGPFTLYLEFDQRPTDPTEYILTVKLGVEDNIRRMFGPGPIPVEYLLRAAAFDDSSRILWAGYLGTGYLERLTSAALVEFALVSLTAYYRKHTLN